MHLDTGDLFAENARVLLDAFDPRARMLCAAVYAATLSAMDRPAALAFAALLPGALCMPLLNPVTGRLFDRFGGKLVGIVGFSLLIAGTASFVFFSDSTPVALVAALYLVRMVGVAFILMPMTAYCMTDLGGDDLPQGTATVNSLRQICGSLGSSVMVAVVAHASAGAAVVAGAGVSMHGFSVSFGLQAVLLGVLLAGTIAFVHGERRPTRPRSRRPSRGCPCPCCTRW